MTKPFAVLLLIASLPLAAQATELSGDAARGAKLHQANCISCHDDKIYQRNDRTITSLKALTAQISSCGHQTDKTFTKPEQADLVKFLNNKFYKFK